MKRLAVIPARGGSKRIPKKNIKDFCGQPMISYILNCAINSNLFEKIHISTEDLEIASCAEKILGEKLDFMRPASLADDFTALMPVLNYVKNEYAFNNQHFDEIWMLMPCSPLLEIDDLHNAADAFSKAPVGTNLLTVAEYPTPIEWAFNKDENDILSPCNPGMFKIRSQDISNKYYDTGSLAIFLANNIGEVADDIDKSFVGFTLPKIKAVDIDTEDDWKLAEALFLLKKRGLVGRV